MLSYRAPTHHPPTIRYAQDIFRIRRKIGFALLIPKATVGSLHFVSSKVILLPRSDPADLGVYGSRKIVWMTYASKAGARLVLLEAHAIQGVTPHNDLFPVIGQGYGVAKEQIGSILSVGRKSGTDFLLYTEVISNRESGVIRKSLQPLQPIRTTKTLRSGHLQN